MDVTSLFTVIPNDEGLRALKHFSISALLRNLALKHYSAQLNQYLHSIAFHSMETTTNKLMAQRWVPKWDPAKPIVSQGLSNTNFLVNATAPNLNSMAVILTTASALPPLPERSSLNLKRLLSIPFTRVLNIPGKFPTFLWLF